MEKSLYHANRNHKKARVAMLISGKTDFKIKRVTRNSEEHSIVMKTSVYQEGKTAQKQTPKMHEATPQKTLTKMKGEDNN